MRVVVAGDIKQPVLLDTTKATALLISTDDGKPNVIFKMLPNNAGWLRLTKGEDPSFDTVAKELKLI